MMTITEWLTDLSENCSVQRFEDIEGGIFKAKIKGDIYLIRNAEVKKS